MHAVCGIAGLIALSDNLAGPRPIPTMLREMAHTLRHRGPDDEGFLLGNWLTGEAAPAAGDATPAAVKNFPQPYIPSAHIDSDSFNSPSKNFNLGLAGRRLAILDLSPAGHQPMCTPDGNYWIVHNGEIYNYKQLRDELKALGHRFVSDSDTEVILHAFQQWDRDCLNKFNGMWAFALWDVQKRRLFCARDRFGVKPFYYYAGQRWFAFASEIKALLTTGLFEPRANDGLVYDMLARGQHDLTPFTLFEGVKQLRGGEWLELNLGGGPLQPHEPEHKRYWDLDPSRQQGHGGSEQFAKKFYEIFEDAVRLRLISDVPVGTCLSGGLDSSAIVCVLDRLLRQGNVKIPGRENIQKTFSVRYRNSAHDEGPFIEAVVNKTAIDAHHIYPEETRIFDELQKVIYHQDEPFTTLSIFAQWNVFRLARQAGVTVTLDGQGADESLAGYHYAFDPFFSALMARGRLLRLRSEIRAYAAIHGYSVTEAIGRALSQLSVPNQRAWLARKYPVLLQLLFKAGSGKRKTLAANINKLSWVAPDFLKAGRKLSRSPATTQLFRNDIFENYLYFSAVKPGLHHLLHYEDRNSMAYSIESRVPFLDYRLVEFLFSLPPSQKINRGMTKIVLRNAMAGVLPEEVRTRKDKIGFSTPQDVWFRTLLKEPIYDVLSSASLRQRPYFDAKELMRLFESHQEGSANHSPWIWRAVCMELWLRRFIDRK